MATFDSFISSGAYDAAGLLPLYTYRGVFCIIWFAEAIVAIDTSTGQGYSSSDTGDVPIPEVLKRKLCTRGSCEHGICHDKMLWCRKTRRVHSREVALFQVRGQTATPPPSLARMLRHLAYWRRNPGRVEIIRERGYTGLPPIPGFNR